jgi:toxin YoeB
VRKLTFTPNAWDDYLWLQTNDRKVLKRTNTVIADVARHGHEGIGKAEQLNFDLSGWWSKRITGKHRLVYRLTDDAVEIVACRGHYDDH